MYQIDDIVQSITSKIKYKVLGLPSFGAPRYKLEALEDSPNFNRWDVTKGEIIYLSESLERLLMPIIHNTVNTANTSSPCILNPEPISEESDPFGLIAQRKALRDLIGF